MGPPPIGAPVATAPPPPKKRHPLLWGCGGLIVLAILIGVCGSLANSGNNGNTASSSTPTPTSAPSSAATATAAAPKPQFVVIHDGAWRVGQDVQPGTYRTRTGSRGCYFDRLSGFSGQLADILANENEDGPAVITIGPDDKGFDSKRCATWTSDLSAITQSRTSFGEGEFIVGTDIQPGTYRSDGPGDCYWSRVSGWSHELTDVIANDNTAGPAIVTIAATDKGFTSRRCGTWSAG